MDQHMFFHPLPGHWVCHAVGVCHVCTHSHGPCCQPAREDKGGQKAHHRLVKRPFISTLNRIGPCCCLSPLRRQEELWESLGPLRHPSAQCQGPAVCGKRAREGEECWEEMPGNPGQRPAGGLATGGFSSRTHWHPAQASLPAGGATEPQGSFRKYQSVKGHLGSWGHKGELPAT